MALIYVDDEVRDTLKAMAKLQNRPIVEVIRRLLGTSAPAKDVVVAIAATAEKTTDATIPPEDPEARWEWTKKSLGAKCGCIFDDEMKVVGVKDWGLFRTVKNGALMEQYLAEHPGERDKYAGVVVETTGTKQEVQD